jgi:tight adherence protein B
MAFDFDPIYLIYALVAASAGLFAEGFYLLCFTGASYRNNVNRRLKLLKDQPDRENILVQLRKERGLTSSGGYSLKSVNFNQLVLQSGLTVGIGRLVTFVAIGTVLVFVAALVVRGSLAQALPLALFCGLVLPIMVLRFLRSRRQKAFGAQFPDALDMIVRSLRAGHPVPIAARSRAPRAAISARFCRTCPPSFANASRCGARFVRSPPRRVPPPSSSPRCRSPSSRSFNS